LRKLPPDLLRVSGGDEKVLKQAKETCASEALEIATYDVLERLAIGVDDRHTAELAASIRGDEQRMLERILRELPNLTAAVVAANIEEQTAYQIRRIGAADSAPEGPDQVRQEGAGS